MRAHYWLSALLYLIVQPLHAGQFRTLCFFGSSSSQELYHIEKNTLTKTDLPSRNLSQTYQFTADKPITFGRPHPEKPNTLIPHLTVTAPEGVHDLIILFLPSEAPQVPLKAIPINASWQVFKAGELMFLNFSQQNVSAVLGKTRFVLPSGSPKKIASPLTDDRYFVSIRSEASRGWRPLFKGFWPTEANLRRFIIVFDDPKNKTVRLMGIPDRQQP
jgi:hypothetical protein